MQPAPPFEELIAATTVSAVHLEMRDTYTPDDAVYLRWLAGEQIDWVAEYQAWYDLVRTTVGRGVHMRRARVVSEPLASFIRQEFACTGPMNIAAGEDVRWLPRRQATDLALPGNDFWLFDERLVRVHHFSGDGQIIDEEVTDDPAVVTLCTSAFEAVWQRATPHERYQPS
jgi:hypothetical protein